MSNLYHTRSRYRSVSKSRLLSQCMLSALMISMGTMRIGAECCPATPLSEDPAHDGFQLANSVDQETITSLDRLGFPITAPAVQSMVAEVKCNNWEQSSCCWDGKSSPLPPVLQPKVCHVTRNVAQGISGSFTLGTSVTSTVYAEAEYVVAKVGGSLAVTYSGSLTGAFSTTSTVEVKCEITVLPCDNMTERLMMSTETTTLIRDNFTTITDIHPVS
jgi:hypothetical protein